MELKETNHEYYCECYESERYDEYESWREFKKESIDPPSVPEGKLDFGYNLPFRFDIQKDEEDYWLELHFAQQRHGRDIYNVVVKNIQEEDMEEIEQYLKDCKKYLMDLWKEVNLPITNK